MTNNSEKMATRKYHDWLLYSAILCLAIPLIAWNYWIPLAKDYLSQHWTPNCPINCDFYTYYKAGGAFIEGTDPYLGVIDMEAWGTAEFVYPPLSLTLFTVFSRLDYEVARLSWAGLNLLLFSLAFLATLLFSRPAKRMPLLLIGSLLFFTSYPLLIHLRQGQIDLIVASLIVGAYIFDIRGKPLPSAFLLALATLTKLSPAFLLAFFIGYRRQWKYASYYLVSIIAISGLSLIIIPPEIYIRYLAIVVPFISEGANFWHNQSITRFVADNHMATSLVSAIGVLAFAILLWRAGSIRDEIRDPIASPEDMHIAVPIAFFLNVLIVLLFSAIAWPMAYVWVLIPSALVATTLICGQAKKQYLGIFFLGVVLANTAVYQRPFFDILNMLGNLLLTPILVLALLRPREVFKEADISDICR